MSVAVCIWTCTCVEISVLFNAYCLYATVCAKGSMRYAIVFVRLRVSKCVRFPVLQSVSVWCSLPHMCV